MTLAEEQKALAGKIVLVTGAATGIGAAIAAGFAAEGAEVFGADIAWRGRTPANVHAVDCDVADEASVARCVADIESRHGAVDILVNNAALAADLAPKPFEEISPEEWVRVMSVNTLAPFLCTRAVAPAMRKRKSGRIINITSGAVFGAGPNNLHYFSSKGAIAVMTRSLARELGGDGITVNAIAPGLTLTEGIESNPAYSQELKAGIAARRCIPRPQYSDDVVGACLFLASEGASFVSAQILSVDGGEAIH